MEVDSGGSVVPSRRRVRRAKRPADSNKNFEDDELQPPAARRNPPVIVDGPYAQDAMQGLCIPPVRLPRSAGRRQSISCARCRIYDWKEHRFAKPSVVKQRRQPKVRQGQKSAAPTSDSDIFSWNLSLEERRKRDSRSALPTAKNVAVPTPTRRILRPDPLMENDLVGCAHEGSTPMTIGPSTSEVNCCLTQTPDALKTATKAAGVRRRRNGAATAGASVERAFQAEMVADEVVRGTAGRTSRKRIMGQAAPMPLARSAREVRVRSLGRSDKGQRGAASGHTVNEAAAIVKGVRSSDSSADAAGTMADEEAEKRCAQDAEKEKEKEKQKKTELAKRAMEELMKHQNFAPVEVIVADAISKDPLGFVHSLRDAKLLRSLEKLAQLRQLNVSSEEAKSLRKQRKKEKKREKREKKKQKRLMRLAANCGVSIEQLELEMSMDRSDSRASAPGSSPLSLNGSLLGSANTPPTLLTSSGLSNLPGPSPGSYLNVFPRPSFVPDPLNPLRNLAAERTDSSRQGTPNGDSYSPLILPPAPITTPNSTHSNERDRYASSDYAPSFMSTEEQRAALANGNLQNLQQCGDYLVKAGRAADDGSNGNTPEDEEDEQNAIAISHLFPQFDALQQLKLIQMCTDSKVEEVDEQDVVSMVLNPEAGSSNKVARTLALIKGKVKEFKEINGMRRASDGGCSIQEGEPRLLRIDEDEDVDVEDVGGNDAALLEQVRRNAMRSSWRVPEPILSASEPVETRTVAGMRVALQPGAKESSGGQCIQSFVSSAPEPCTSTQADVDPLSNCITGMADMGFGLQPRMLSILDEPLNSTPLDDHPPHRTPAVTLTEVPVHEDDENIYTSEMKVVTDWFNHAPYGAGRDAHIRYWDDVRQRVIVADWIRKLQQKRFDQVLLNLSRRRIHRRRAEMRTKGKRRSKSTEPWWPRKLFEHYEGALDLAGKVMRTADSSSGACDSEVPSINNVAMKVIRLDDDETATLAYFRPGSPLTVSDPTDDYQEHVLAQDLDEATLITKDVFTQMDLDHDDEKVRYLPWLKVRRISAYSSISAPGSTRTSSRTSNKSTHASALTPVPTQSEPSADIDSRSTLVSTSNSMPVTNVALVKQPNSQQFLPAASNTYGFLAPNGCYPSHSVYAGVIGTSSDKLSVPVSQVPLLAPDASRTIPIGLPPLSTVFDGLQQPSASCVPYVHLPTQTQPGLSNPYGEIVYTHSQVTAAAAQSFAGFPASAPSLATNIYAGNEQTAALPSTSGGKVHRNSDANGLLPSDFLRDSHSSNHLSNAYHASGGLTKDSIVDQDMEDFFRTVLEECETRPTTHSESQPFFDEEMDPFLAMDQLT